MNERARENRCRISIEQQRREREAAREIRRINEDEWEGGSKVTIFKFKLAFLYNDNLISLERDRVSLKCASMYFCPFWCGK